MTKARGLVRAGVSLVGLTAFLVMSQGCSSSASSPLTSSPEEGVYVGRILDDSGKAVAGAIVSVDGVEANAPTDKTGRFVVSDKSLAVSSAVLGGVAAAEIREISVIAPGFVPHIGTLSVNAGDVASIEIIRKGLEPVLVIASPAGGVHSVPVECDEGMVTVTGYVDLEPRDSVLLDLMVLVDVSGSTGDPAFNGANGSVLDVEKAAVECFLESLDWTRTRVGLVTFEDEASHVAQLTDDPEILLAGLASIGGSNGGTNFEAGFLAARDAFLNRAAQDLEDATAAGPREEGGEVVVPEVRRAVIFLTDGVPTTHGIPPVGDNIKQSPEDRAASIEAARVLGEDTGAEIYGFTIVTADTADTRFTTMPHSVAAAGGGRHVRVESVAQLEMELCGEDLVDALQVTAMNLTTGEGPFAATLSAGGRFDVDVPVVAAPNGGLLENVIVITAVAFPDDLASVVEESVTVVAVRSDLLAEAGSADVDDVPQDPTPLAQKPFVTTPTGKPASSTDLYDFLVGSNAEFEDAVELYGLEALTIAPPLDPDAPSATITVDVVYKNACYVSEFGYVLFDADKVPSSHVQALKDATEDNVLLNTGDLGASCDVGSIAAGTRSFDIEVPRGKVVIFFILPDFTLESWHNDPRKGRRPIFTVAKLNPANFVQVLTFVSENGRTEPGASTTVVTPGRQVLFAFEDIEIASQQSDLDFGDLIISVRQAATPAAAVLVCE